MTKRISNRANRTISDYGNHPDFPRPGEDLPLFFPVLKERFMSLDHPDVQASRLVEVEESRQLHAGFDSNRERRERTLSELLKAHNKKNAALIMTLNDAFMDMFLNWVRSCDDRSIDVRSWSLIFATDAEAARRVEDLGFAVYIDELSYGSQSREAAREFGDRTFVRMLFAKAAVVQDVLNLGYDVLFQDADVVWHKDPSELLIQGSQIEIDAQFMYDGPNAVYDPLYANCGFFFLRNTAQSKNFWTLVFENYDKVVHYQSLQRVVNLVLMNRFFKGLRLDILPEEDFANGHLFDIDGNNNLPEQPYVVHCSWTSNIEHKIEKYKLADLWYL